MGAKVTIDQGALARLLRRRSGRAYQKIEERTKRVADIATEIAPGHMGDYVSWRVEQGPKGLRGVVKCDHPAVFYVLQGTRPHIIRPKKAKALHFFIEGEEVFTKLVRHPGTKKNPFLQHALRLGK